MSSLHDKLLREECIEYILLDLTHIESVERPGFELFIESCDDRESDEDEDNSEYSLQYTTLICDKANFRDNTTPTNCYECQHECETSCIDECISDASQE